ncbi:hypothetical protein ACIPO9_12835 [Pseudomonas sp. NPDC090203]|uniref:hypothetical protein n=1 Tax=Pseudomonas sp. NPDC090203 TaxID=3364477 RepID=UPI00382155BA
MKPPSDLRILRTIYKMYYRDFISFALGKENSRQSKVYVPIDCKQVATKLGVDGDIVFGRLYYHFENRYGYKKADGSDVHFFAMAVGRDNKCVNFPFLASVLAELEADHSKFRWSIVISTTAVIISLIALYLGK